MSIDKKTFLITGAAGFIGSELVKRLLKNGEKVVGLDNVNNYYDQSLKRSRLSEIEKCHKESEGKWFFYEMSIENNNDLDNIGKNHQINIIVHLAAQAGVRNSILNPEAYLKANLVGFYNILEFSRNYIIENFIFASSSSVYGGNNKVPFREIDNADHPISFYGATKKSNEVMAHSYSHLFDIPSTGLRFFTVYGPWGRPDMAPMLFAKAMLKGEKLDVFNYGDMIRDFTYIDDVTETIFRCCYKPAFPTKKLIEENYDPSVSNAPFRIFNVGNNNPIKLIQFINLLEENLGVKANKNFIEIQKGDVQITSSDSSRIYEWINFAPQTRLEDGIKKFTSWYKNYYENN